MTPMIRFLLGGCILLLLIVLPVAASPILASESFIPNPPLVPGGQQQLVAAFAIPSGTTFPKDHELQLQTQLTEARWNIQVIVDGHNAASQPASGSAAFINGMLLSYSVNHDVQFTVTITGNVPTSATGTVTVLDMVEIDNSNNVVPGSEIVISQPVAGAGTPAVTTSPAIPTHTPQLVTTAPVAQSPGFSSVVCLTGVSLAFSLLLWRRRV